MYPFERFTEHAKETLKLAQEEAERGHHSYIGTEHLLLGLLRQPEGVAAEVLKELKVEIGLVRETIASVLARNERIIMQQVIPTSRVKVVIEIAFDEARRMGHDRVGTGHILMALVMEGEGIAAHVLEDLGATAEKVVAALENRWGVEPTRRGKRAAPKLRFPNPTRMQLREMRTVAGFKSVAPPGSDVETLQRLLSSQHVADTLRQRGLDVDTLAREIANPPEPVLKLRGDLTVARSHLADAVARGDYERAAQVQKTIAALSAKLTSAEGAWLKTLGA
jgi:ATP-dependent Clp protease ATP-binding subunit ClpA